MNDCEKFELARNALIALYDAVKDIDKYNLDSSEAYELGYALGQTTIVIKQLKDTKESK